MYVRDVANQMHAIDQPEWILSGSELIHERDDKLIQECMYRLSVDSWRGIIVTQDTDLVPGGVFTKTEKWYGIEYHVADTNVALLEVKRKFKI